MCIRDGGLRREAETLAGAGYRVTVVMQISPPDIPRLGWNGRSGLTAVAAPPPAWAAATGWRRPVGHAADLWRWGGSGALRAAATGQRADVVHGDDLDTQPAAPAPATGAILWVGAGFGHTPGGRRACRPDPAPRILERKRQSIVPRGVMPRRNGNALLDDTRAGLAPVVVLEQALVEFAGGQARQFVE